MPKLNDDEYIYQCDCNSAHYVRFSVGTDGYLFIEDFWGSHIPFKDRLKLIWKILRGKECIRSEVIFSPDAMDEFVIEMSLIAKKMEDMK